MFCACIIHVYSSDNRLYITNAKAKVGNLRIVIVPLIIVGDKSSKNKQDIKRIFIRLEDVSIQMYIYVIVYNFMS